MLSVKHCCCVYPLQVGTFTLLIVWLVSAIVVLQLQLMILLDGHDGIQIPVTITLIAIAELLISSAGLYGVYAKNSISIIPFAIQQVLGVGYLIFLLIQLIFTKMAPSSENVKELEKANGLFFSYLVLIIVMIVIQYHFFVVVYSFYKELKQEENCPPPTTA